MTLPLKDPDGDQHVLKFDETGCASYYEIENGSQKSSEHAPKMQTFNVSIWLGETKTKSEATRDTCRLLVIENPTTYGNLRYPMNADTFECMRARWEFPPQYELSDAIFAGGCASFKVEAKTGDHIRTNFLIGGGIATFSVGAIYSHDVDSNTTTGCIILGQRFKWHEETRNEFYHSLRDFDFNPIAIPVLVTSILIHKVREERGAFLVTLKKVEEIIESIIIEQSKGVEKEGLTQKDYRSLITKLSQSARILGRIRMTIERAKLVVKFVARSAEIPNTLARDKRAAVNETIARGTCITTAIETVAEMDGSKPGAAISPRILIRLRERIELFQSILEHIDADMINLSARLTAQNMTTTNLVAQQDVHLSFQVATDSKAIADAAHRDGATMKLIGWIGAAILPASVVASILSFLQLNLAIWELLLLYFGITIVITIVILLLIKWLLLPSAAQAWKGSPLHAQAKAAVA